MSFNDLHASHNLYSTLSLLTTGDSMYDVAKVLRYWYQYVTPARLETVFSHYADDLIMAIEIVGLQVPDVPIDLLCSVLDRYRHDEMICRAILDIFARAGERAPVLWLIEFLQKDKNWHVQAALYDTLKALAYWIPQDVMLAMLQDEHEGRQRNAIEIAGDAGEHAPMDVLIDLMRNGDYKASDALGNLGR